MRRYNYFDLSIQTRYLLIYNLNIDIIKYDDLEQFCHQEGTSEKYDNPK